MPMHGTISRSRTDVPEGQVKPVTRKTLISPGIGLVCGLYPLKPQSVLLALKVVTPIISGCSLAMWYDGPEV